VSSSPPSRADEMRLVEPKPPIAEMRAAEDKECGSRLFMRCQS
jgi:hypothetical protein